MNWSARGIVLKYKTDVKPRYNTATCQTSHNSRVRFGQMVSSMGWLQGFQCLGEIGDFLKMPYRWFRSVFGEWPLWGVSWKFPYSPYVSNVTLNLFVSCTSSSNMEETTNEQVHIADHQSGLKLPTLCEGQWKPLVCLCSSRTGTICTCRWSLWKHLHREERGVSS